MPNVRDAPDLPLLPTTICRGISRNSFQYVETDGQLQAIKEVKQDMEQPRPMDRLLCGDVGFGEDAGRDARRVQGG